MATTVNITARECEIADADLPNGHFWRLQFVDIDTGDTANLMFNDAALFGFLGQLEGIRSQLRN